MTSRSHPYSRNTTARILRVDGWMILMPNGQKQFMNGISEAGAVHECTQVGGVAIRQFTFQHNSDGSRTRVVGV